MHPDMVAIAELVCQACGEVTTSSVPRRTDTMPACSCGGRRQLVRILHGLRSGERPDPRRYERLRR
jgi:ribosomal protein L44E